MPRGAPHARHVGSRHFACRILAASLHTAITHAQIIRVNGVCARPVLQLFERPAEIVKDLAVDEVDRSIRCQDVNECGNPADQLLKVSSFCTGRFFDGAFSTLTMT